MVMVAALLRAGNATTVNVAKNVISLIRPPHRVARKDAQRVGSTLLFMWVSLRGTGTWVGNRSASRVAVHTVNAYPSRCNEFDACGLLGTDCNRFARVSRFSRRAYRCVTTSGISHRSLHLVTFV
jgi:hypothetical protein